MWDQHPQLLVATKRTTVIRILATIPGLEDGLTVGKTKYIFYIFYLMATSVLNKLPFVFSSNTNQYNRNQCNQTNDQHYLMSRRRQSQEAEEALAGGPNKANIFMSF